MGLRYKSLSALFLLGAAAIALPTAAVAQTTTNTVNNEALIAPTPNDILERAFFRNDPNFYRNRETKRQIDFLIGPGSIIRNSYPENEIARDGELVTIFYQDLLDQQTKSDPFLRTPDLPNPYSTSILQSPQLNPQRLNQGTEFRLETLPPR
jgi:hypothetical protein